MEIKAVVVAIFATLQVSGALETDSDRVHFRWTNSLQDPADYPANFVLVERGNAEQLKE